MTTLTFDLSEDELPIFLAESDEQLQMLDEGFVRLEREADDPELLQAIFRAAHTLKGSSGTIGHRRMAELTHALETVLDNLRRGTLAVNPHLVDVCLETLDGLRLLLDEVRASTESSVDSAALVTRLAEFSGSAASAPRTPAASGDPAHLVPANGHMPTAGRNGKGAGQASAAAKPARAVRSGRRKGQPAAKAVSSNGHSPEPAPAVTLPVSVSASIAAGSIASSARALQLMLALQEIGRIASMQPDQAQIDAAAPVRQFTAEVQTSLTPEEIYKALAHVSEIDEIVIAGRHFAGDMPAAQGPDTPAPEAGASDDPALQRLGEYLISTGQLTAEQVTFALAEQAEHDPPGLLGQRLVRLGLLTQDALDQAVAQQMRQLRAALEASGPAADRRRGPAAEKTVRTSVERLDNLMNLVGELITDRNRLNQIRSDLNEHYHGDERLEHLSQIALHVGRITDQLQEEVMRIRMLPIASVFNKFPRLVRDLARKAGKDIDLVIRGEDTELDRTVIEQINDPLLHLLRNAVDHAVETPDERRAAGKPERGTILLMARHEESRIILTVEDDGRGIDVEAVKASAVRKGLLSAAEAANLTHDEAVQLIFKPGLSTAKVITDLSGRGVGMDIVRANLERLSGAVAVETWPGKGTRFEIGLPLTLAIMPALLVHVAAGQPDGAAATFAVPLATVIEAVHVPAREIHTINGKPVIQLRGRVLPLLRLDTALAGNDRRSAPRSAEYIVAVRWAKLEMGLVVDALIGEQELVIKSLGPLLHESLGITGAAILGDGRIALIVDVPGLFKLAGA